MYLQFIEKISIGEQTFGPGASGKCDVSLWKDTSQLPQCRNSHYCVADPIGSANYYAVDSVGSGISHFYTVPGENRLKHRCCEYSDELAQLQPRKPLYYNKLRSPSSIPICGRQPNCSRTRVRSET